MDLGINRTGRHEAIRPRRVPHHWEIRRKVAEALDIERMALAIVVLAVLVIALAVVTT